MTDFTTLMHRADTLRRCESDPIRTSWWDGYILGLRCANHGEKIGTIAEHELWFSAIASEYPLRAALGRGYHAGLTLELRDPT
jgi:hypothetical protein